MTYSIITIYETVALHGSWHNFTFFIKSQHAAKRPIKIAEEVFAETAFRGGSLISPREGQ